jgi:hypothetical protein
VYSILDAMAWLDICTKNNIAKSQLNIRTIINNA